MSTSLAFITFIAIETGFILYSLYLIMGQLERILDLLKDRS